MTTYRAGIDVGSTTIKLVLLDEHDEIIFGEYRRHCADIQPTLRALLQEAREQLGPCDLQVSVTGSGSMNLGKSLGIPFVQEVVAVATALQHVAPQTDVAIELGGEDAKIIYFTGGLEERMNGICAGGTGAFIDQMAALLQTDAAGLNAAAENYTQIYPIAARCGVFAKTDIQPLVNEGAQLSDLAASIFQAVVNQTISGLACGKPIRGCVAFLGGPLHFLPELKNAFIRTLKLDEEHVVDPANSHLFAAMGAALESGEGEAADVDALIERLAQGIEMAFELKRLDALFESQEDYDTFARRHGKAQVTQEELATYEGDCFLGIDAGSTTTKLALIGSQGQLLWSFYANNQGSPIKTAMTAMADLAEKLPASVRIVRSCSTGYGEGLLKAAFSLDEGEVETIAHTTAASFFDPLVDCVLDIGGQDMKYIRLQCGSVDTILLNEACSSGCGSFIESFAQSLGYTAAEFAELALFAKHPIDLGTRCTVFMNSNVKQAQKEGATVQDISAGLAYSVIKNALFKVIKLSTAEDLGSHVVLQGGTFYNQAVLRAFEKIAGVEAVCPDISGLMGAFGAALIARNTYSGQETSMLPLDEIAGLTYTTRAARCGRCSNNCMLTISTFASGERHITGNRCERGLGGKAASAEVPNVAAYKLERMFAYEPLAPEAATRGVIGIPRVLNMYENYPFWATFFAKLGFRVELSPLSTHALYELGMDSIPSESECYPAKLAHGHVQWLINNGVQTIFHPSVFYERQENPNAQNHFNCPIVVSYPENLKNNLEDITEGRVRYVHPFLAFTDEDVVADRLVDVCAEEWQIPAKEVRAAVRAAWAEQLAAKADVRAAGKRALEWMEAGKHGGIVLAGRPYHMDPEINHGIPEMIASYGLAVLTEDSLPDKPGSPYPLRANDQWVYHSRLYAAAGFVSTRDDLELIQLNSFGCGLDAVTTDQVAEILEANGKLYTVLKIDEVNNLGAARIRIRSLLAAMRQRAKLDAEDAALEAKVQAEAAAEALEETLGATTLAGDTYSYDRTVFTEEMREAGYTILAPQMTKIHFDILQPVFIKYGYNVVILENDNRSAIDAGLRYVNNDACYPSIISVGQIMDAVMSGKYDTDRLAIIMTQTGGCCRASNYVGFIRRALDKVGLSHIPVISLNGNGMETNPGFKITLPMLKAAAEALVYGDLFMRCVYRVRPYEEVPGSTNALHEALRDVCIETLVGDKAKAKEMLHAAGGTGGVSYNNLCKQIVRAFDTLPIDENLRKPRVGVVGEILVKYMPLANNFLVELLEREGAEAMVPDLMDFMNYSLYNATFKASHLGIPKSSAVKNRLGIWVIQTLRRPALKALEESKRFEAPLPIAEVAKLAEPLLSIGNQYGEGWFLTGEMCELITTGVPNIVCVQPFACLPNHVVGKGVIKALRAKYPEANVVAVDYDPGASEVNQLNRIKLMLSQAKAAL